LTFDLLVVKTKTVQLLLSLKCPIEENIIVVVVVVVV